MLIVDIIEYGLAFFIGLFIAYRLLASLITVKGKAKADIEVLRRRRFAVVLVSDQDDKVTNRTLYSLFGILYPQNLYDIYIVADAHVEISQDIASSLGANVLQPNGQSAVSNGNLLGWAFDLILSGKPDYDAVAVIISGSLVSGNYLEVMNSYLEQGSLVVRSSTQSIDPPGESDLEKNRFKTVLKKIFLLPRVDSPVLGFDGNQRDNGTCIGTEMLQKASSISGETSSFAEYILRLRLEEIPIDFAPEATVWRQVSSHPKKNGKSSAKTFRESSRIIRKYAPQLFMASVKKRSLRLFESFLDLLIPTPNSLLLFLIIVTVTNGLLWGVGWLPVTYMLIWMPITAIGFVQLLVARIKTDIDVLPINAVH